MMDKIIKIKALLDEDFVNYKKCSMFIGTCYCNFKCEKEDPKHRVKCQNSPIAKQKPIEISVNTIVDRYLSDPLTEAIVLGGLEPFDQLEDIIPLILAFRKKTNDDIVIYTGYTPEEFSFMTYENENLYSYFMRHDIFGHGNFIIKFGRFRIGKQIDDPVLGITLASDNQFACVF